MRSLSPEEDRPFFMLNLATYRDVAKYTVGSNEPKRSGREAMELYDRAVAETLSEAGAEATMKAEVEGVMIGDGREWSEWRLTHFPSHRAFREAAENAKRQSAEHHRAAAIEDIYTLQLSPQIDRTRQSD